jgi:DNA-binding transcriptional LysR family regulator
VDGVESEDIARDEWLALVPEKAFPGKTSITLRELARHKFLMSGGGCERHILRILASTGIAIANPMMVKQIPTIHAMVAEELGVSLIPQLSFSDGWACRTLPLKPRLFRHIGMIRSTSYVPIPASEACLSLVRTRVQQANKVPSKPLGTARRIAG